MSLSDYISGKKRAVGVGVSTSYIKDSLRDSLVAAKSGADLHRATLSIDIMSEALCLIGYPRASRLLYHIENPSEREFSEEYANFLRWCGIPRSREASSAISRLAADVGRMRSSYFLGDSFGMDVVNESVEMLSGFASEHCERVKDIIENSVSDMDIETGSLLICAHSESLCKIATNDGSLLVERSGNIYTACEASGKDACSLAECVNRHMRDYSTMYFTVPLRAKEAVSESIRRMYLGKPHGRIAECLSNKPMDVQPDHELWSMSVRGSEVSRSYGVYWLNETARPRIVRAVA